ncbi:hypothetical protein AGMMS49983_13870 [Clostridia bacterium]|nr:hypothetical protein AGMMS49983_13870 [Clostridia bacterium]
MTASQKDFEAFQSKYQTEEKEILVLTDDGGGGAGKFYDSWDSSKYFLAYYDIALNELKKGKGRINWLISDDENREHSFCWPHYFMDGVIYRLRVRELADKTVPEGRLPSAYNRFMVVEVLEENAHNDELASILAEYRKPVILSDKVLGEFELNKNLRLFGGRIQWLGRDVSVSLEVNPDSRGSWTKAMNVLRVLFGQQEQRDAEFRAFAAGQLTELANDWRQDEDTAEISKADFISRIHLSELAVDPNGNIAAYYTDDDMFLGHAVTVHGNTKKCLKSANIEG